MSKFTYSDIHDGYCTVEQYASQFQTARLEVGEDYVRNPGKWDEKRYTIIFMDDKIAVGVSKDTFIKGTTDYTLFYSSGVFEGWKYNDTARPSYRLQAIS